MARRLIFVTVFAFLALCAAFFAHGGADASAVHGRATAETGAPRIVPAGGAAAGSGGVRENFRIAPCGDKAVSLYSAAAREAAASCLSSAAPRQEKKTRPAVLDGRENGCGMQAVACLPFFQIHIQTYKAPPDERNAPGKRPDDPRASPEKQFRASRERIC